MAKPIKASDAHKAWNKRTKPSSYRINSIPVNKTILIFCEGQTEKIYFESFRVVSMMVDCIDMKGESNKMRLIERCEERVCKLKKSGKEYDEIWCVYDMDLDKGEKEKADFDNSIKRACSNKYKVAYSNDSFELWFYLHYQYTDQACLRDFYYEQLSAFWNINYSREGKSLVNCKKNHQRLQTANPQKAMERAERLHTQFRHLPYHQQNPVTTVYLLVKILLENMR